MPKRRTVEDKLAELGPPDAAPPPPERLREALADRESLVIARAAEIVRRHKLRDLAADLLTAFDRLASATDTAKADPRCRAKTEIVQALTEIEHDDAEFYLRSIGYRQLEPVWGGSEDTAAHLRGLCGYGLVVARHRGALARLVELLCDPEKTARVDAVQALAATGREDAALLLRLKALTGDREYEVVGECFTGLLSLEVRDAIPFIARFLKDAPPDVRLEAAAALGSSREAAPFVALRDCWQTEVDREFRKALLIAIGSSRQPAGIDFLLQLVASHPMPLALDALAALAPCRFYADIRARVEAAVSDRQDRQLQRAFERDFAASSPPDT
jgi:HEAT repeat protein